MKTRSSAKASLVAELELANRHGAAQMVSPVSSAPNSRRRRKHLQITPINRNEVCRLNSIEDVMNISHSSPCGPSPNSIKISTPIAHFNDKLKSAPNVCSPNYSTDISFGNDSYLLDAVAKIENNRNPEDSVTSTVEAAFIRQIEEMEAGGIEKNCKPSHSEASEDIMDILPASQVDIFPASQKGNKSNNVLANKDVNPNTSTNGLKMLNPIISTAQSFGFENPINTFKKSTKRKPKGRKKKCPFKIAYTNRTTAKILSQSGLTQLSVGDLSRMSEEQQLLLSSWGLPRQVVLRYKSKGVASLFPWQLECLGNPKVLEGSNLLYSAPTSAGKTLVAEILMLKRVLELGKKAIMILPFVSVAREKMYSLQELFGDAGVRVEGFMGSYNPPGGFKAVDIAICTIEKANSLINRLLEESCLSDLGTIVVDEMHLIGDSGRGYLLEILLTKILFMTLKNKAVKPGVSEDCDVKAQSKSLNIQIIGMSATLPNLSDLAKWLNAELVTTQYRPVPLSERIKIEGNIYDKELQLIRPVISEETSVSIPGDVDDMINLSLETILGGHSILIFCPTKALCENNARRIAKAFFDIGKPNSTYSIEICDKLRNQLCGEKLGEVINQLKQCPAGLDDILNQTVSFGVAYHHAGLTFDERDILESAFKRCVLRVIIATSTLSAGVNLPARRVLISTPKFNGSLLDPLTYCQMAGRAGRKGIDSEGESILLCPGDTKKEGVFLFQSQLNSVKSALINRDGALTSSLKRALLEVIASGVTTSLAEIMKYSGCTLLSVLSNLEDKRSQEISSSQANRDICIGDCLKFLIDNEFVKLNHYESNREDEYVPTNLGMACLASSLSPDEGIFVFKELQKAVRCFVLDNELHIIYQVTPTYLSEHMRNIDFTLFLRIWESLDEAGKKVAELVGVSEVFIIRGMTGTASRANAQQTQSFLIHQRFFAALALNDLVNEMSITEVSTKYNLAKGTIQNLQQAASTFAGMVTAFCGRLGWSNLELLLSQFQERLQFGTKRELCDLVRLSMVNGQKARVLYDAGIKSVVELAAAEPASIEHILHRAGPFQSNVHGNQAKRHWMMGKGEGLTEGEVAQMIVNEAREFLQVRSDELKSISMIK